jgi:large subunit ribosomal protein L13
MILEVSTKVTPHVDCGDNVIVINSENQLQVTKWTRRSTCVTLVTGRTRTLTAKVLQSKNPALLVEESCKGMLPKQNWC